MGFSSDQFVGQSSSGSSSTTAASSADTFGVWPPPRVSVSDGQTAVRSAVFSMMAEPPKLDWDHLKLGAKSRHWRQQFSWYFCCTWSKTLPPWNVGFRVVYPVGQKSSAGFCSLRTGFVQPWFKDTETVSAAMILLVWHQDSRAFSSALRQMHLNLKAWQILVWV